MEELIKASKKIQIIQDQIYARQSLWKDLKQKLKDNLQQLGEQTGLEFDILITDHIEHWESVSFKLKDQHFSYYVKGTKRQAIIKHGGYLVYGLMPSGFIKVGMVFPKIDDIKEKEISFKEFELMKDLRKIDQSVIENHMTRFLKEVISWELGEGADIKERIGFKISK